MMKNEKGFTIMELMVVIVIIGVLAAIGVPAYNNMVEKARETACKANKRTIATAVGMYFAEHGAYVAVADTTVANVYDDYLDNITGIRCPTANGAYAVSDTGVVTCTIAAHND